MFSFFVTYKNCHETDTEPTEAVNIYPEKKQIRYLWNRVFTLERLFITYWVQCICRFSLGIGKIHMG